MHLAVIASSNVITLALCHGEKPLRVYVNSKAKVIDVVSIQFNDLANFYNF